MKSILILGGTQFIGRNLVEGLLQLSEYEITLFNRQRTQPNLFPKANKLKGNRETDDIKQINSKEWDYIIDLSCYYPNAMTQTLKSINTVGKYILISTCSVYDTQDRHKILRREFSKIKTCNESQKTDRDPASYGNRKAECERILVNSGLNHIILRPSLVYGTFDHTDRFYYWLYQVKQNKTLLLPNNGNHQFSLTYVNDLVNTIIKAIREDTNDTVYNIISQPMASIRKIVDTAQVLLKKESNEINVTDEFLNTNHVSAWVDIPLWINGDYFTYQNKKLLNDFKIELTTFKNSVESTISYYDTLEWQTPKYGISDNAKERLIQKWSAASSTS